MSNFEFRLGNKPPLPVSPQPACRLVAATAHGHGEAPRAVQRKVRTMGRPDTLTAQRVEVGIVLHAMLGMEAARDYFSKHDVDDAVVLRVLSPSGPRRGSHDANGIRT